MSSTVSAFHLDANKINWWPLKQNRKPHVVGCFGNIQTRHTVQPSTLQGSLAKLNPARNAMKRLFVLNTDGLSITQTSTHRSSPQPQKGQNKICMNFVCSSAAERERRGWVTDATSLCYMCFTTVKCTYKYRSHCLFTNKLKKMLTHWSMWVLWMTRKASQRT